MNRFRPVRRAAAFLSTDPFQRWSMATTPGRPVRTWTDYKTPAKDYIRAFSGDERYFRQKIKEDSLRNVLGASGPVMRNQILMRKDFRPVVTPEPPREAGRIAWLFRAAQPPRGPAFPVREISHVGPLGAGIAGAADWGGDPNSWAIKLALKELVLRRALTLERVEKRRFCANRNRSMC